MSLLDILLNGVLQGLISPMVFVPAIVLGWLARAQWQALAGGALVAVVLLAMSLSRGLPEGASMLWWLAPVGLVAPMLWAWGTFHLRRWLRAQDGTPRAGGAALVVRMLLGGILGAALGAMAGIGLGMAYVELAHVSNFEGGAGYLAVFGFGIPGLLVGAVAGVLLGVRRSRRAGRMATN